MSIKLIWYNFCGALVIFGVFADHTPVTKFNPKSYKRDQAHIASLAFQYPSFRPLGTRGSPSQLILDSRDFTDNSNKLLVVTFQK